jgi:hypothetical protein
MSGKYRGDLQGHGWSERAKFSVSINDLDFNETLELELTTWNFNDLKPKRHPG